MSSVLPSPFDAINISWCADLNQVEPLAYFFAKHVSTEYISHGELWCGRAVSSHEWSPNLLEVMTKEFNGLIKGSIDGKPWPKLAVGRVNGELVCLAIVNVHDGSSASRSYAVFEDIVVNEAFRGQGVGTMLLKWLENAVINAGCSRIFLESSIDNNAHSFFHHQGFQTCSVTMIKSLATEKTNEPPAGAYQP